MKKAYSSLGLWIIIKVTTLLTLVTVSSVVFVSGLNVGVEINNNSYNVQDNYFYNNKLLSPPYFKSGGDITFFSQFYLSKNFHENSSFVYMLSNGEDRQIIALNETFNGIKYSDIKVGDNFSDYIRINIPESFTKGSYDISVGFAYDEQPLSDILTRTNVDNLFIKVFTIYRVTNTEGLSIALAAVVLVLSLAGLSIALAEVLLPMPNLNMLLSLTAMLMSIGLVFITMILTFSFAASMWSFGRVIIPNYLFILTLPFFIVVLLYSLVYLIVGRIDTALYLTIAAVMYLVMMHIHIVAYQGNYEANMLDILLATSSFFSGVFNERNSGVFAVLLILTMLILTGSTYRRVLFKSTFTLRFYLLTGMLITNIALFSIVDYTMAAYTGADILEKINSFEFFGLFIPYFTSYINL